MDTGFSVSLNPIVSWPLLLIVSLAVVGLTVATYARKLRGPGARWRWFAIGLRLVSVLLCLLAAMRPSVIVQEKKTQASSIVFLMDSSTSMKIQDEANGQSRWAMANEALSAAVEAAKKLGGDLDVVTYLFDSDVRRLVDAGDVQTAAPPEAGKEPSTTPEPKNAPRSETQAPTAVSLPSQPEGRETQLGTALLEVDKLQSQGSRRTARLVLLSDFIPTGGVNSQIAARRYRDQQTPISTVVFGTQNAGEDSRDLAVRDITVGSTVFVKNKLEVRGSLSARGYAGQTVEVELLVDDEPTTVAKTQLKIPENAGAEAVAITGLHYTPQTPGDKKLTLKVAPQEGELVVSNNEISTFVTVLSGGLNVLYLHGPNFTWDFRYLMRAVATSPDIDVTGILIRTPAVGDKGELDDDEFTPGRYDAYVLSDMAADFLTKRQQRLLTDAVKSGAAGLIMLGGRTSFGPGGWGGTDVADLLPIEVHPGDGQIEPEGGVKFVPNALGLNSYLLQIGEDPAQTQRLWELLPRLQGSNRFGRPKAGAEILGTVDGVDSQPMMLVLETGRGRTIAYGADTWVWARDEAGVPAHRKFWRQAIFWLAHKEDQGADQIKLTLDRRRASTGQSIELTVTGRDAKGAALTDVQYEARVERDDAPSDAETAAELVEVYSRGEESRGSYAALGKPGDYKVTVIGRRNGQEIGRDSARFLVYQDDRELENPAADPELARQIAEITAGEAVPAEQLAKHLTGIDQSEFTEYVSPTEHRIWDTWPFFLLFTLCLTLEWWLRKRHGWV